MNDRLQKSDNDDNSIIRYDGIPTEPFRPHEPTRWQRFLTAIWPFARQGGEWAKYGGELGKAYLDAEIANRTNTASRTAAEAAETAARADFQRQDAVRVFNDQIDSIFKDNNLPHGAKILKLAKLMEANPDLAQQVEKITDIVDKLALRRGARIEIASEVTEPAPERTGS
jgi:hypothetical protein